MGWARLLAAASLCGSTVAWGSTVATWEMASYQDFLRGRFENVSLSRDGALSLAPRLEAVFSTGQAVIWSVAEAPDGAIYAGTGNRGRLYRIDKARHAALVWTADQPEIFAVTVGTDGSVFAATSPDGRIYRVRNDKAEVYFDPHQKYIWALAVGPDGALYAGTGDQGKVFRITGPNQGAEYYGTGQAHVTGLSFDVKGAMLAGTEPNGILYRITAQDRAFVLYDANLPEIRAIANGRDGSIYAVGLGGSVNHKTQTAAQAAQAMSQGGSTPVVTTSITVTADAAASAGRAAQPGAEVKPPVATEASKAAQAAAVAASTALAATSAQPIEVSGVEKSAIYKIAPDNTVETLWSSKEENIFDLLARNGDLLFSTDDGGRIYQLSNDRKLTLLAQTNEMEATRLIAVNGSVFAATGNAGKLFALEGAAAKNGSYESPIFDAQSVARWGRVRWASQGAVTLRTRTGNSLRPDRTWSDWSENLTDANGSAVRSPNARYIQWSASLSGPEAALENFSLAYLPQNSAPVIRSIIVTTGATSAASSARSSTGAGAAASSAYSITVTDTGDAGPATSTGTPTQTISRATSQQLVVSWQAEDADGDRLVYAVWFRGDGEHDWKLYRTALHDNAVNLDGDALADGRYYFKVTASDREANPPDQARDTELVSAPVLIDNTPPLVRVKASRREGTKAVVDFEAADATSALRRCEYSVDAGPWMALNSVDGVIDSPTEQFHLVAEIPRGERVVVVRAVDSGGNAGLAKIVIP